MFDWLREKLNPAQANIVEDFGTNILPSSNLATNKDAYSKLEVVNRGVNLITDSASEIKMDIGNILDFFSSPSRIRKKKLDILLNFRPNPYYNADIFKRNIVLDLVLEGDAFIYFDGVYLYNLPALKVEIVTDKITYIKEYKYANKVFKPDEIIHIQENSADSIFTGKSRLDSAKNSMNLLLSMNSFQKNFFDNSAVPGIILTTPNPLSEKVKQRIIAQWVSKYNPKTGGKKPMIIDGDFKIEALSKYNFKELDFNESIATQEITILKALGVPPILLDSGNNANINPNLRMFYIQTIMPIVNKIVQGFEMYFGYDIKPVTQEVLALTPELREIANFHSTLVNAGIVTRNESREELRRLPYTKEMMDAAEDNIADQLILPANIAGSAVDSTIGGAPSKEGNNK